MRLMFKNFFCCILTKMLTSNDRIQILKKTSKYFENKTKIKMNETSFSFE